MTDTETYRVLVLGDFHFGESYTRAGAPMLAERGYDHSTERLRPFIDAADSFVLNLETPLVDPDEHPSPLTGQKSYVHWADPEASGAALKALGVDAVSLANNHTVDHGHEGLESTFQTLSASGIPWFGAGRNLGEANEPYRLVLPERVGGGEIQFHGSFQYSARHDADYDFYAGSDSPGCAPLKVAAVPAARGESTRTDSFHVAFPHWGANYKWRSPGQYRLAHRFLNKDYDLVLGHGGHSLQEVHRKQQRWVIYGIGNGVFNSGGRWKRYEEANGILPFSFWVMLEVHRQGDRRSLSVKLYPVYSDNSTTEFQPGPLSEKDFNHAMEVLASRPIRPWRFDNPAQRTGKDSMGWHIELDLGHWSLGEKPSRLEGTYKGQDPGDWPLRSPSVEVEDEIFGMSRPIGPALFAVAAQRQGASVKWVDRRVGILSLGQKKMLFHDYRAHESDVGGAICKDKVLAAKFLDDAGVRTPNTRLVKSPSQAVEAANSILGPVVVKPSDGRKSRGVSTGLLSDDDVRQAFVFANKHGSQVMVQEHIQSSEEIRVMASGVEAIAANGRIAPQVVGDGVSTIRQLIDDKNSQRSLNPSLRNRDIPVDHVTIMTLDTLGISLDYIASVGEVITVRNVGGVSVGADTIQKLDDIEPGIVEISTRAVGAIPGLEFGGVDLMIEEGTGVPFVIELNTMSGYGTAQFPTYGEPRDVAEDLLRIRLSHTTTDVGRYYDPIEINEAPHQVFSAKGGVKGIAELSISALKRQGYDVTKVSSRLYAVEGSEGKITLLTSQCTTVDDKAVVRFVMSRHDWVNRILMDSHVPVVRGSMVQNYREFLSFIHPKARTVVMHNSDAPWPGRDGHVVKIDDVQEHSLFEQTQWAQANPLGKRFRVLASRSEPLLVTTSDRVQEDVPELLTAACRAAVRAVRAVPELRWSAVDVVVRPKRVLGNLDRPVLVEGMSLSPSFTSEDIVICGDIDEFSRFVMGNSGSY